MLYIKTSLPTSVSNHKYENMWDIVADARKVIAEFTKKQKEITVEIIDEDDKNKVLWKRSVIKDEYEY